MLFSKTKKVFLWMSTNDGLSRFDKDMHFINYDIKDGIQGNEIQLRQHMPKVKAVRFCMGGMKGFTIFNPLKIELNKKYSSDCYQRF